jgi:hypothetical protein
MDIKQPTTELPKKQRKRGPKLLALDALRTHTVSVRLNSTELAWLDDARKHMQRGEYLRYASRGVLPPTIPSINLKAWSELAKASSNLNQLARKVNGGMAVEVIEVRSILDAFRLLLLGGGVEDESEN